jgi:hypothetical protein
MSSLTTHSQVYQQWVNRYITTSNYPEVLFASDKFGNCYCSYNKDTSFITVKYNSSGIQQWILSYRYPGSVHMSIYETKIDNAGNFYFGGDYTVTDTNHNYLVVKCSPAGNIIWTAIYDSPTHSLDNGTSIAVDNNGNVFEAGTVRVGNNYTGTIVKFSSAGTLLWAKKFLEGNQFSSWAGSIIADNSGNCYFLGTKGGFEGSDTYAVKYNSSGDSLWAREVAYSGIYGSSMPRIKINQQNQLVAVVNRPCTYFYNCPMVWGDVEKFDSVGNILCSASFSYGSTFYIYDFTTDNTGNTYIAASINNYTNGHAAVVKTGINGQPVWVRADSIPYSSFSRIVCDNNSNVYAFGFYSVNNKYHFRTKKYSTNGDSVWSVLYSYSNTSSELPYGMAIDTAKSIYVMGSSLDNSVYSMITIKYNQLVGIEKIGTEVPDEFSLNQNYPNPFNPSTKIHFEIPFSRGVSEGRGVSVKLVIYDVLGKEINILVNEQLKPGTYEVEWNANEYSTGIYFYKLTADDYTATRKMVLMK